MAYALAAVQRGRLRRPAVSRSRISAKDRSSRAEILQLEVRRESHDQGIEHVARLAKDALVACAEPRETRRRAEREQPGALARGHVDSLAEAQFCVALASKRLERLSAQAMELGRERALSGTFRLLQGLVCDMQCLIRIADDDQGLGQVSPMGESHSLADRAKKIRAFTNRGDAVRLSGSYCGPPCEHQSERGEEAKRVFARQGEELAAHKADGVRLPA